MKALAANLNALGMHVPAQLPDRIEAVCTHFGIEKQPPLGFGKPTLEVGFCFEVTSGERQAPWSQHMTRNCCRHPICLYVYSTDRTRGGERGDDRQLESSVQRSANPTGVTPRISQTPIAVSP